MKNKRIKSFLTTSILLSSLFVANSVFADDFDTQIQEAQEQAQENEQAADSLNELINQLTNDISNTQEALTQLNNKIAQNEASIDTTLNTLELSYQEMNTLLEEIDILEKNIQERSVKLEEQARMVQVSGNPTNYVEFILNAESLTDVIARIDVVGHIVNSSNRMIQAQIQDQEAVEVKREETERKITQQNALMEELEATSADLEVQKASQTALVAQIEIERNSASGERSTLIAQRDEALQLVNSLENDREAVRIAAERASRERAEREEQDRLALESSNQNTQAESSSRDEVREVAPASSERESTNSNSENDTSPVTTPSQPPIQEEAEKEVKPEPKPEPKPEAKPDSKPAPVPSGNVLSIAAQYTHINKYTWGGNSPSTGFDCSGFTKYVFEKAGKTIPRNSRAQYSSSTKVSNPQPGDLVFFSGNRNGVITHVGIYVGGGQFIGSQTSTGVAYASATTGYWGSRLVGYGRY